MPSFADRPSPSPSDWATASPAEDLSPNQTKRWLVIDADGQLARRMSAWMPSHELVAVPDVYHALGELGTQPRFDGVVYRPPVASTACHASTAASDRDTPAIAAAIRTLAPDACLLAVLAPIVSGQSADAYRQAGFDRVLSEPLTERSFLESRESPPDRSQAPVLASVPPSAAPQEPSASAIRPIANRWIDPLIHGPTRPAAPATNDSLGDLDLVEHLLQRADGFSDLAIALIQQQTGWSEVGFHPSVSHDARSPETVCPSGHAWLPVEYQGQVLGRLHAPVPTQALAPWAIWLSRWLALQAQTDCLWDFSFKDELTGAWNRRYFNRFLQDILGRAATQRFRVTLMLFDIDDFKQYNDRYGHAAGDEILRETARMIRSEVRKHDVVARIGGDEFAVIFWDAHRPRRPNSEHPVDVRQAAHRFQQALKKHKFPKLASEAPGTLTISGGLSSFPWDGRTPDELLEKADDMAMLSKKQGKNAITFGPGVMRLQDPT